MVFISTPNHKMLLDCGLHQTNDRYNDYIVNKRKFKEFKPKEIDLIFVTHIHSDHFLNIPRLYSDGFSGKTIVTCGSKEIMEDMGKDCANINERDTMVINSQRGTSYRPLFSVEDVYTMLENTVEYKYNNKIYIDEELSFELIPSGHLFGSCQIMLYIKVGNATKTILYTGDIGNKIVENRFVGKYQQVENANLVIGESTYGDKPQLNVGNKERKNDVNKLKTVIDYQVKNMNGRVIIPVFAQSRCQSIALMIYQIYKTSKWKPKVYIDSPLSIKIFDDYSRCLIGTDKEIFDELINSDFLTFVKDPDNSKALVSSDEPCVILSTAGMCQVGRIRHHLKKCIPDSNATILFVGYATPDSLAGILRDPKRKTVTIDQKEYSCRCSVYMLKSLSGHAPFNQLVDNYSRINCQKIVLHHGTTEAKECLKLALENEFRNKCQTTRVVIANSSLKFTL